LACSTHADSYASKIDVAQLWKPVDDVLAEEPHGGGEIESATLTVHCRARGRAGSLRFNFADWKRSLPTVLA